MTKDPRAPRSIRPFGPAALALVALSTAGCMPSCIRRKPDEVRVREKVDALTVHLFVASKLALVRSGTSPDVRQLRDDLISFGRYGQQLIERAQAATAQPDPSAVPGTVPSATASAEPAPTLHVTVTPSDVARAAASLWHLRSEASRLVRTEGSDGIPPVLPSLLQGVLTPELTALIDANTEHALLLLLGFLLRVDERVPVPIPPEIILYEAWRTDADRTHLPGMADPLHAVKSVVYAEHDLCDMAAREAAAVHDDPDAATLATQFQGTAAALSGGALRPSVTADNARAVALAGHGLAHGSVGLCYLMRADDTHAMPELRVLATDAQRLGVPPEQTGLLRAYIAVGSNDRAGALAALADARRNPAATPDDLAAITSFETSVRAGGGVGSSRSLLRARIAWLAAQVLYRSLAQSGMLDALRNSDVGRTLTGYFSAVRALVSRPIATGVTLPTISGGGGTTGGVGGGHSHHGHGLHHLF